jgi:biotin-dependent carboxylase-like uncharacterized protein
MMELVSAPAYATVQDAGREGFRSSGVPRGGAMDLLSLFAGNTLLGNEPGAAAIEWALTGGIVRFDDDTRFVLTGATAEARIGGAHVAHGRVLHAKAGEILAIERITAGRFLYVCVRGGIAVPEVLGGRGTYVPAAFGGLEGRRLASGDVLTAGPAPPDSEPMVGELPPELQVLEMRGPLALMRGPQADTLTTTEWQALADGQLLVTPHSDRTGYRLSGLRTPQHAAGSGKSEPSCTGAVQLTPAGELIVLMADGPTVGGYPKIAVVAAAHLSRLAQASVGDHVSFQIIEPTEAIALLAAQRSELLRLRA